MNKLENEKQKMFKALKYGLDLLSLKAEDGTLVSVTDFTLKYHDLSPDELRTVFDKYAKDGGNEFVSFNGRFISRLIKEYHEVNLLKLLEISEEGYEEQAFDYIATLFGTKLSRQENQVLRNELLPSIKNVSLSVLIKICSAYARLPDKRQLYGSLSVDYISTILNRHMSNNSKVIYK
jgi:hypothetical protein